MTCWYFVRTFLLLFGNLSCSIFVGILSGLFQHYLGFCPDHLNMIWNFVRIIKFTFSTITTTAIVILTHILILNQKKSGVWTTCEDEFVSFIHKLLVVGMTLRVCIEKFLFKKLFYTNLQTHPKNLQLIYIIYKLILTSCLTTRFFQDEDEFEYEDEDCIGGDDDKNR